MKLKDEIKKSFSDKREKNKLFCGSSKIMFITMTLIFFLAFYLLGAGKEYLGRFLSPNYILLIITMNLFVFFCSQEIFFEKKIISYIISGIFIIASIIFILPLIF